MNILDEPALQRLLKGKLTRHILFMYGNDDYLKEYYCNKLRDVLVNKAFAAFNVHIYNDADTPLEQIFSDAQNVPMMSEYAFYLVKNYPLNDLKTEQLNELEQNLAELPDSSFLLFCFNTLNVTYNRSKNAKWANIIELFARFGDVIQLDHRSPQKLAAMLIKKAESENNRLSEAAALYFVQTVGEDTQTVSNEFNKLLSYAGGEPITEKMIDTVCVKSVQAQIFDLGKEILSGNADKAFQTVIKLINEKTELPLIIGTLAAVYTNLYRYMVAKNANRDTNDLISLFDYKSSYVFKDIPQLAGKTSLPAVIQSISILLKADVTSKSTGADALSLMTTVISELSAVK